MANWSSAKVRGRLSPTSMKSVVEKENINIKYIYCDIFWTRVSNPGLRLKKQPFYPCAVTSGVKILQNLHFRLLFLGGAVGGKAGGGKAVGGGAVGGAPILAFCLALVVCLHGNFFKLLWLKLLDLDLNGGNPFYPLSCSLCLCLRKVRVDQVWNSTAYFRYQDSNPDWTFPRRCAAYSYLSYDGSNPTKL